MKSILLVLLVFASVLSYAQLSDITILEQKAIKQYDARLNAIFNERRDSVFNVFTQTMDTLLSQSDYCTASLDSLATRVSLQKSPDQRVQIISWDNLSGGSFHYYTSYLSIITKQGQCKSWEIDTDNQPEERYIEAGYYQVDTIYDNELTYYLLLGYGTYGGGKHHWVTRIFEATNDSLVECIRCYPNLAPIVVYTNRTQNPNLVYNSKTRTLSFQLFHYDDDGGFYSDVFNTIAFRFINGRFVKE